MVSRIYLLLPVALLLAGCSQTQKQDKQAPLPQTDGVQSSAKPAEAATPVRPPKYINFLTYGDVVENCGIPVSREGGVMMTYLPAYPDGDIRKAAPGLEFNNVSLYFYSDVLGKATGSYVFSQKNSEGHWVATKTLTDEELASVLPCIASKL
jgi:hypothetical protein